MVTHIARDLIARMPYPCPDDPAKECPAPGLTEELDAGED
jgi:hypothetical protein